MNQTYERRWLRFAKGGKMKYIGHLDLLRVFQAAIRRAKLPVAYSMGFNPHLRISFAMPLPVGMESTCEYMELLLDAPCNLMLLDKELPEGLRILEVVNIAETAPKPAAILAAADYRVTGITEEAVQAVQDAKEIITMKKTKSGEKETDIRTDILDICYEPGGAAKMKLSAGSTRNLSPYLVFGQLKINSVVRTEMYASKNGMFVPLHEIAL